MSLNKMPPLSNASNERGAQQQEADSVMKSAALARRRMLLKSVGKGSAVIAAAVPLQSLATTALLTPTGLRCSVSGMQSGVHSKAPDSSVVCGGYSPGWWGQAVVVDGKRKPRRAWPVSYKDLCTNKFTKTGTDDPGVNFAGKSLFNVMDESTFSSTKTRHWIGAYLNGFARANNFPYTAQQILDYYNLPNSDANRAAMYSLITGFLENHS